MSQQIARSAPPAPQCEQQTSPPQAAVYLQPQDDFPWQLSDLELVVLQVLHSRICLQLERESLNPEGPHPVALERQQVLAAELDARHGRLT